MNLFVSPNLVPFVLVIFHCLIFNFLPTKEVLVLTDCLILSLISMDTFGLVMVFIVVVNTLALDEQAELLRQLRKSSDLSIIFYSKTVVWGWERRFWNFKVTFPVFSSVSATDMMWVPIFRPKDSICCDGFRTDFFRFMTNPR